MRKIRTHIGHIGLVCALGGGGGGLNAAIELTWNFNQNESYTDPLIHSTKYTPEVENLVDTLNGTSPSGFAQYTHQRELVGVYDRTGTFAILDQSGNVYMDLNGREALDIQSSRQLGERERIATNSVRQDYQLDFAMDYRAESDVNISPYQSVLSHYRPTYKLPTSTSTLVTTDQPVSIHYQFSAELEFNGTRSSNFGQQEAFAWVKGTLDSNLGFAILSEGVQVELNQVEYLEALRNLPAGTPVAINVLAENFQILGEAIYEDAQLDVLLTVSPLINEEIAFRFLSFEGNEVEGDWMKLYNDYSISEGSLRYNAQRSLAIYAIPEAGHTAAMLGLMVLGWRLRRNRLGAAQR